jgi:hypothetical protein
VRLTTDQLTIYLHDHLAGATIGVELARRARRQNAGTELGEFLAGLVAEVEEDRAALEAIMDRLDAGRDALKVAFGWTSEKVGRLKLNGRILGYAPLSRVLELEGLRAGVQGKLSLWQSLRAIAPGDARLDADDLDRLIARAEAQMAGLAEHHRAAAVTAFGDG